MWNEFSAVDQLVYTITAFRDMLESQGNLNEKDGAALAKRITKLESNREKLQKTADEASKINNQKW